MDPKFGTKRKIWTILEPIYRFVFVEFIVQMAFIEPFLSSLDKLITTDRSKRYIPFIGFRRSL